MFDFHYRDNNLLAGAVVTFIFNEWNGFMQIAIIFILLSSRQYAVSR